LSTPTLFGTGVPNSGSPLKQVLIAINTCIGCWICVPMFQLTPWRWHSGAETCRHWYHELCFMFGILLELDECICWL